MAETGPTQRTPQWVHGQWLAALDRLILRRFGSYKRAEELTGARCITLRQWRQGKRRPSFQTLLQTLDQLGFDLLQVTREADLYPQLNAAPRDQLAAVLPRRSPRDPVLGEILGQWPRPNVAAQHIPEHFNRLELILDRDPRVARAEFLETLGAAETPEERCAALCLWAMWLNSRGQAVDAGLAVLRALEDSADDGPLFFLLLSQSASVCKNLNALDVGKLHAERSIFGFLRLGDLNNGARGLLRLGILCWALDDFSGAERAYLDALRLCPESRFAAMCRFNLIYNFLAQNQVSEALAAMERGRPHFATLPPAYALRMHWLSAKVLIAVGRRRDAVAELRLALDDTDLELESPLIVFQVFLELAELMTEAGSSRELASLGRRLLPLVAVCDDSAPSVAICRAFLHALVRDTDRSWTPSEVRAYALRFHQALETTPS